MEYGLWSVRHGRKSASYAVRSHSGPSGVHDGRVSRCQHRVHKFPKRAIQSFDVTRRVMHQNGFVIESNNHTVYVGESIQVEANRVAGVGRNQRRAGGISWNQPAVENRFREHRRAEGMSVVSGHTRKQATDAAIESNPKARRNELLEKCGGRPGNSS